MLTIRYGSKDISVIQRQWTATERKPYRKTYRLIPGQSWEDAEETNTQWETYVVRDSNSYIPVGALVAQELIEEGAFIAGFIEMWAGRTVFVDQNLICQPIEGQLAEILEQIKKLNNNKLGGFPDVVGLFENGRIAMREIKNTDTKDRLGAKQHELADLLYKIFGRQLDLQVVEWKNPPNKK